MTPSSDESNPDAQNAEVIPGSRPVPEWAAGRRNIMLAIAYDGTDYRGWQVQPNGITVQECVESAVEKLTGETRRVFCAGRTDSGVHAIGQVANFRTNCRIPIQNIRRGLQRFLPTDIVIVSATEVHADFHATYSAVQKKYRYVIADGDVMPPFLNRFVCRSTFHLDADLMAQGASHLLGTHDFRCFETEYPNKSSSVRNIMEATITRTAEWSPLGGAHAWKPAFGREYHHFEAPYIVFEVMADGFLYNMVRAIVGTLMEIGRGLHPPSFMADVIQSMDRNIAGTTAPANGLYLVHVEYPQSLLTPIEPA